MGRTEALGGASRTYMNATSNLETSIDQQGKVAPWNRCLSSVEENLLQVLMTQRVATEEPNQLYESTLCGLVSGEEAAAPSSTGRA